MFAKRDDSTGPVDQSVITGMIIDILASKKWLVDMAMALSGMFSLSMVLFLAGVFVWRRPLVNRVSLRLIFAISLFDFGQCITQAASRAVQSRDTCIVGQFFTYTSYRTAIYLSSAIAFNLQMVFHRKSQKPLPRYVEYLYYIVSFAVASIHTLVFVILSRANDVCNYFNLISNGTPQYIVIAILLFMSLPSLAVFYNVIASTAVIITLYTRQRKVTKALDEASKFTREYLLTPVNNGTNPRAITAKEKGQLEAARRVYRSCIRIALYPLAPLVWWILIATFYIIQYYTPMTHYSDVDRMVSLVYLTWVAYPAMAFINFLVFITDPAVTRVVTQVRKEIRMKLVERRLRAKGSQDTLDYSQDGIAKLPHMALSESYGSGATHGHDGLSVISGAEKEHLMSHATTDGLGPLEGGESVSTLASGIYNDSVFRRIRADGDAESLMDRL